MNTKFRMLIIFTISLILILTTLFAGENVALNDNGDYLRVNMLCSLEKDSSGQLNIVLQEEGVFSNVKNILFSPEDVSVYPSSQLILVRLSVAISYLINSAFGYPQNTYNIYYLGILMSILYALALGFSLSHIKIKNKYVLWSVIVVSLIMMCDIGYVSYFNSLYGEGLQHILFVALLGFIITLTYRPLKIYETVVFFVLLILYGQSKFFNIPVAGVMGLIFLIFSLKHKKDKKSLLINITSFVLSVTVLLGTMNLLPSWISEQTNYNAVFYGILKDCDDEKAKEYLEELGIDSELYTLKNTNFYVSDIGEIINKYDLTKVKQISQVKLMMFYLKHPILTLSKAPDIACHSNTARNIFFMDSNHMTHPTKCTIWSKIRENTGFDRVYFNVGIIALFTILMVLISIKQKMPLYVKILMPILSIMAFGYAFFVPYISNGEADLAKHMYLFVELVDVAIIGIVLLVVNASFKVKVATSVTLALLVALGGARYKKMDAVDFGGIEWYVIDENDSYRTLISKESVAYKQYHNANDNNYKTSDIHRWLNEIFIDNFSEQEKEQLYVKEEKMILSKGNKDNATMGNRDYYCSPYPERVAANYETAYKENVCGSVFLPTSKTISMMANKGYKVVLDCDYWLSTPYFNNSEKSRFVSRDGFVYFEYATEEKGIRPVIYVKTK